MPRVMEFVKLFDPMAYAKANSSKAAQDLERARNSAYIFRIVLPFFHRILKTGTTPNATTPRKSGP